MIIAIIVALVIGAGTSATAELSLPGDLLYPVKVSINENIRAALTLSEEAGAQWRVRVVERRAEEAERLAAGGEIDAETSAQIQAEIDEDFKVVEELIAKFLADGEHGAALQVSSSLESVLTAHSGILTKIIIKKPDVKEEIQPIIAKIKIKIDLAAQSRVKAEAAENKEIAMRSEAGAEGKLTAAENKLKEVERFYASRKEHLSAQVQADMDAKLKLAAENITRGKVFLESKNYVLAFENFNKAMRVAQEAKILMVAGSEIRITVPGSGADAEVELETKNKVMQGSQSRGGDMVQGEVRTDVEIEDDLNVEGKTHIQIKL